MQGRLHHVALGARDVEAVAMFYRDVMGLAELRRHHEEGPDGPLRSIWLELGPQAVLMVEKTQAPAGERVEGVGLGPFLLAFHVEPAERQEVEGRLEAAGALIESRTEHSSYARDPEGNRVAISCYPL